MSGSVFADPRVGSELAGYRIERLLGRGGMSVVYLAHHERLDRRVALKLMAPELSADEGFRERFLRESRLAASLDHPNVLLQKTVGIAADPLLVAEGADAFLEAVADAALVVAGLSANEGRRELGSVRLALLEDATPPVLLVRAGLRPGGLAPRQTLTRFTWSVDVTASASESRPAPGRPPA